MVKIKRYLYRLKVLFLNRIYDFQWFFSKNRLSNNCLDYSKRNPEIIVSLTSFPERINFVHKTIKSILNQKNIKPNSIELWLAEEQFPNKDQDLPVNLLKLKKLGLDICWCTDLKSYKKLIPALEKHPNSIIVTADDDIYYTNQWLEKLYKEYLRDPSIIHCHRATKFYIELRKFKTIPGGYNFYENPSFLNKLVGIGGVLYPPKSLHSDIFKYNLFMKLAPTNDDIWFWFMAILNDTRINVVKNHCPQPLDVFEANKSPKLTTINDNGEKLFWVQFRNLIEYYPEIKNILFQEYN